MSYVETHTPDRWVVIEVTLDEVATQHVLAGFWGGYLDGDYWRMSSGITNTTEYDDRYEFDNRSGSQYICYKAQYGFTGLSASVLEHLKQKPGTTLEIVKDFGGVE
jgi:hypothetical protein